MEGASKVDMSLDDIIKMNRRKNRTLSKPTRSRAQPRGKFNLLRRGVRNRSNPTFALAQDTNVQAVTLSKRRFNGSRLRAKPQAAVAVLRRARQTAVAAAKAAADAGALLQLDKRQQLFDQLRGVRAAAQSTAANSLIRSTNRPVRGSKQRFSRNELSVSYRGMQPSSRGTMRHRVGQRNDSFNVPFDSLQSPVTSMQSQVWNGSTDRGNGRRRRNAGFSNYDNLASRFTSGQQQNRFRHTRQRGKGFVDQQLRNQQYLAQARALIRAQNEYRQQESNFNFHGSSRGSRFRRQQRYTASQQRHVAARFWDFDR